MKIYSHRKKWGENEHEMQLRQNISLKNIILYIAESVPDLQEVKLNKLLYIAHLYHYSSHGEMLTMSRFFCRSFGPYAPKLRRIVQEMLDFDQIHLEDARTSTDPTYSNPCKIIKTNSHGYDQLPDACRQTLAEVLEDWGAKRFPEIIDYSNRTIPFLATPYREQIDLALFAPCKDLRQVLPKSQRAAIHRFVELVEDDCLQKITAPDRKALSIQEIAEIYLALRGAAPEASPSPEHLGFNARKILEACRIVNEPFTEGGDLEADTVDIATRLIYFLLDSMGFRQYTGKVALNSGILFLMKQGLSLHDTAVEQFWLQEINYDNIRKWVIRLVI